MLSFEEPGGEFDFEKEKKKNVKTRVRVMFLFTLFVLMVVFLMKNNYRFDLPVNEKEGIGLICHSEDELAAGDDEELQLEKANSFIKNNKKIIGLERGFQKAYVTQEAIGYRGKRVAVINVEFEGVVSSKNKIPERICGFRTKIVYK